MDKLVWITHCSEIFREVLFIDRYLLHTLTVHPPCLLTCLSPPKIEGDEKTPALHETHHFTHLMEHIFTCLHPSSEAGGCFCLAIFFMHLVSLSHHIIFR